MNDARAQLDALLPTTTRIKAQELFDSLPAVEVDDLLGNWHGYALGTGHPLDVPLEVYGWYGKRFVDTDSVHPLVFARGKLRFSVRPTLAMLPLIMRFSKFATLAPVAAIGRFLLRFASTSAPKARLRRAEFRGVISAAMIYDGIAVVDNFRRVDENTIIGWMDMRNDPHGQIFVIERD